MGIICLCILVQELAQPSVTDTEMGYIVPNIDLTPISSNKYRPGVSNDDAQVLTCTLNDVINNSKVLDLKKLCIAKEKLVWVLYCDITCLDYDGSVLDAAVIALIGALRNCKYSITLNFLSNTFGINGFDGLHSATAEN